jgi:ATP/maltotriose-dependent transcriptional regulator MalT
MQLFDEAMVAVVADDMSPIAAGIVYCAVIDSCMQACDFRRAAEWTQVLDRWCTAQPDLVPFRGQCLVHRSQVLAARGHWVEAMAELEEARQRLSEPLHPALGLCLYELGELYRLRGDHRRAEVAYWAAAEQGHDAEPGFALLRLATGNVSAAAAATRRMLDESHGQRDRPPILAAAVEVLLAAGDLDAARTAGAELAELARDLDVSLMEAMARYAEGTVLLASGDATRALVSLRRACEVWRDLGLAYDCARAHVQIAAACRALGDDDAADLELNAARAVFVRLGAAVDLARLVPAADSKKTATALTERECEVLRLVAAGKTNRDIAASLVISEHTVARHLQNIFMKLNLSSRAAATAYAYEHELI